MLTESVDYDLDTHPITAGAGIVEIRAGLFRMQLHVKRPAFMRRNRFKNRRPNSRNVGFGLARVRAPFELFSLVSGASEIGEAIPEGAHSAKIYLVRQTLDLDI